MAVLDRGLLPTLMESLTDYVIDAAFNNRGNSLACSLSSNEIIFFEKCGPPSDTKLSSFASSYTSNVYECDWMVTASINPAHESLITRIDWCEEQFGIILGSCSHDRVASLWCKGRKGFIGRTLSDENDDTEMSPVIDIVSPWIPLTHFHDANAPLTAFKFCPPAIGFRFAVASDLGDVLIYTADDVLQKDLWFLETIQSTTSSTPWPTSIAWLSFGEEVGIAVGYCGEVAIWLRKPTEWQKSQTLQDLGNKQSVNPIITDLSAMILASSDIVVLAAGHSSGVNLWILQGIQNNCLPVDEVRLND